MESEFDLFEQGVALKLAPEHSSTVAPVVALHDVAIAATDYLLNRWAPIMRKLVITVFVFLLISGSVSVSSAADSGIGGIDHFGLTVTDLQASQAFFIDTLGFELLGEDSEYPSAFVANDEIMVTLWRVTDPDKAIEFDRKNNVGLHHLAFAIDSFEALDALHETLLRTPGVVVEFSPELLGAGPTKHMMIREPSGNRLEFIHRPPR